MEDLGLNPDVTGALRGRRILVTGHTGFKGSWLALWLHRLGAKVSGYSLLPPTQPNNFTLSNVIDILEHHVIGDVRDRATLLDAFHAVQPDAVFHLAAQSLVRRGFNEPVETFETNTIGTVNVLEAVRNMRRPCVIVVITSDKCYANPDALWGRREIDPLGGNDPYSASKAAAECVVTAYRSAYFPVDRVSEHRVQLASARAGNVIGGGDWASDRIGVDVMRALLAGVPVPVRNPDAVRPWQHVLEPLWGYILLAARMLRGADPSLCEAWNFGPLPQDAVSVRSLVDCFVRFWGSGSWTERADSTGPRESPALRLSVDKALRQLGWRPHWTWEEAVERTVHWYRAHRNDPNNSMREVCLADIDAYEAARGLRR